MSENLDKYMDVKPYKNLAEQNDKRKQTNIANKNIIYYDIETYQYRVVTKKIKGRKKPVIRNKGIITSIALMNKNTQEKQAYTIGVNVDNEDELLAEVRDIFLNKNNILCAWNGKGFDDLIIRKALGIKYSDESCEFFDLMLGYGKFIQNKTGDDSLFSLSDIAMEVGSFKLANMPPETLYCNKEFDKLQEYNLQDIVPLFAIDMQYGLTDIMLGLMDKTGLNYPNGSLNVTAPLEQYIKKENITLGSNKSKHKILNTGGLNFIKGHQYSNLKHFDVSSYYPNMFISLNASSNINYDNIKYYKVKELPEGVKQISKSFWIKNNGLVQIRAEKKNNKIVGYKIAELTRNFDVAEGNGDIRELTEKLLHYKETTTGNERNTYKVLVNGLYGALDSEYFSYEHKSLSASATFLCRYVLVNIIDKFDAVYGKTDSIWTTNTAITEADLDNYSNQLLQELGLPNPCIHWELESEPKELYCKDYNNYVELFDDNELNFKGAFNSPVQKLVLEETIKSGNTSMQYYWNKHHKDISLFCKYNKYNEEVIQYDNETLLADLKNYNYKNGFKAYKYYSMYGNVLNEVNDEFDLPVHKTYGLSEIGKILKGYGFIDEAVKFKAKKEEVKPKYIPMYLGKNERLIQDNKLLNKQFKVKESKWSIKDTLLHLTLPENPDWKYKGLVLGKPFFAIDIDRKDFKDNTNKVLDDILKVFNKNQYVLQETKSGGYHVIFKTGKPEGLFDFEVNSTVEDYKGLELKYHNVLPFNCYKYKVISGDIDKLQNFNQIAKLNTFFNGKKKPKVEVEIMDDTKEFKGDIRELSRIAIKLYELHNGKTHEFIRCLSGAFKGNMTYHEFQEVISAIISNTSIAEDTTNVEGTFDYFYKEANNTTSLGLLKIYIKGQTNKEAMIKEFNQLSAILTPDYKPKTRTVKTELINTSETKGKDKVYAVVDGSFTLNGQTKWIKVTKKDMEYITMFNGVFYNLEVKEDINGLVKPIYILNVERKGADDLTFTGSLKSIKENLFTYSLVFTGDKDQNIMKYLQRAFTSDNGTCKHIKENLTGGYVNTAMLPSEAPSKTEFMKGWEIFMEIWEQLPEIHRKCMLSLIIGNFKHIIISNAIGDVRLIAKAVFMYGTSNSMKTTLVELVKGMFKMTDNVLPLGSDVNSPDTPVALSNALSNTCGLVLVDDNDTIFTYPNAVDFEKVIKATENMLLPSRTDMTKGVGNNREFRNLGCPVITSNKPKINILDKQSILKRSYVFNFTEEFSLSQKLGRNIKPSEVNTLQAVGKVIAYTLRDIDWENLPYNYNVNDLVNHIFTSIAEIYDVDVTTIIDVEVSNEFNPSTIGERVDIKFINKFKTNWKNYIDELDDPAELPFIFENRQGYWIQGTALYDYIRELLNDGGMSKSTMLKELELDGIKPVVKRVGDGTKMVLDKKYSKEDLGKLFS